MAGRRRRTKKTERPEPLLPTHSPDGVDLTLIRWMLSLTPGERLRVLEDHVNAVLRMRGESTES